MWLTPRRLCPTALHVCVGYWLYEGGGFCGGLALCKKLTCNAFAVITRTHIYVRPQYLRNARMPWPPRHILHVGCTSSVCISCMTCYMGHHAKSYCLATAANILLSLREHKLWVTFNDTPLEAKPIRETKRDNWVKMWIKFQVS